MFFFSAINGTIEQKQKGGARMNQTIEEKVFKDPIHGYIRVTDLLIWELIKSPEFQRLRRIKQLGGTHIIYSTAEHSRFSHSLGVYHISRRMIDILKKEGAVLSDHERMLTLCAALLHDLGHGPYSHSFEIVLGIDHEDFTRRVILEETNVYKLLEEYKPGFAFEVSQVIEKTHPNRLIVSLISSEIDADRLDYLLRDSYFTGAPYGEIDLERILRTMRIENDRIVFKYSGMHAIEDYLFSRYQMYWQVYLHDLSLSFNFIIKSMLLRIKNLLSKNFDFKFDMALFRDLFLTENIDINTYLQMDDGVITTFAGFFVNSGDTVLSDLAQRFLNRGLFDEFEYIPSAASGKLIESLKLELKDSGLDTDFYFFTEHHSQSTYQFGLCAEESICLLMPGSDVREISDVSDIIKGIVNAPKQKDTLFLPLEMIKKLDGAMRIFGILEEIVGRNVDV